MTYTQFREKSCTKKLRHKSLAKAKQFLRKMKSCKINIEDLLKMHVYKCRFCLGYHIGHK